MWVKITQENVRTLKSGEKIRYHNGYDWAEKELDDFWIQRGYVGTGVHNEIARFVGPMFGDYVYVWREGNTEVEFPTLDEAKQILKEEGLDPDEVGAEGVLHIIGLIAQSDYTPVERLMRIKTVVDTWSSQTESTS